MAIARHGAGNYVQPIDFEGHYEVIMGWEPVVTKDTFLEALADLYRRLPPRKTVRINGHPDGPSERID